MTEKITISNNFKLFTAIVICQTVGITAGLLTSAKNNLWFDSIIKPSWNPPAYLFAPVWTTLYLLMGISLSLIWRSHAMEPYKTNAMLLFAGQLFLNFWWTILFFSMHSPSMAFIDIILMIISILITIFAFASISKTAAWLLVPYISWVCFAAILNYTIWKLN
ncbi:MAG: tryptophan-rich sensory protein [Flavobacterium sp.]|nr:tryptophan-rich sensory protein [Flavobacterium sp.]